MSDNQNIVLSRPYGTNAERDLFEYAGYYIYEKEYHKKENCIIYVRTDCKPYGYTEQKHKIFSDAIYVSSIDMKTAIIFDTNNMTISTNAPIDFELLRILQDRANELGFEYRNENECLMRRIRKSQQNNFANTSPKDIKKALKLLTDIYE